MDALRPRRTSLLVLACLLAQAIAQMSMEDCCTNGYEWAVEKQNCKSLPTISSAKDCRINQEQCCNNQLEETHCSTGINYANEHDDCESQDENATCETKSVKKCCSCCLLGKNAQIQGQSCEQNLLLGYQCGQVFRACCTKGQEVTDSSNVVNAAGNTGGNTFPLPSENNDDEYFHDHCRGGGPCKQQCRNTGSGYACSCFFGYELQADNISCEDVNECVSGTHTCKEGLVCINMPGSFRCQREVGCGTGYQLTHENTCQDIDECFTGTHNCPANFLCQNSQGSFRCSPKQQCAIGFIQDAQGQCIDINECLRSNPPCPAGQSCINNEGSFTCQRPVVNCGRGFHLTADGTRCEDVNECAASPQPCGEGHVCNNSPGSYRCECRAGFYFDTISRTCADINECRRYPGRICAHKCENTPGSYYCSCTIGFKLAADGRSCEDVDECKDTPCSQECANVYGSYQCYCRRGYQLSDVDGITCEDIDECALPTGGHICSFRCNNVPGSFRCSCPPTGYTLAPNGRNCQDLDECLTGTHNCSGTETCFNVQGGFRCLSFQCPDNYRRSGDSRCERLPCNENECQSLPLRITYHQLSFPTNIQVPTDIFRMGPSNSVPGDDIFLSIISGNEEGYFTTKKVNTHSGIVTLNRPITEPMDILLTIQMQLFRHGTVSTFIVKLSVFVAVEL
ncbi:fibulin-1 isoform X2 [Ambystoma mexicanum]|uniref:fibulin-1 isoform X2 n=1 Tax=Ambystoma mexicanum TaxID=8296 RepID=UPI0037E8C3AF